jgi:hypothetical protein
MTTGGQAAAELDRVPEPRTPAPDPVEEATAQVQLDAQDDPEAYLADTIVPGGGE